MYKIRAFQESPGFRSGYTLIELAVVMVVAGLMVASFSSAYNLYLKTQAEKVTDDRISNVTQAMSTYLVAFGSYPCPARANAKRTDVDYGISTQCDPTKKAAAAAPNTTPDLGPSVQPYVYPCSAISPGPGSVGCTAIAGVNAVGTAGTCNNGICWQTSDRRVQTTAENPNIVAGGGSVAMTQPSPLYNPTNNGAAVTVKFNGTNYAVRLPVLSPLIRRGMVPFRTLGITEDQAYDGYNMRLSYAVTEALAVPGTYTEAGGAIDMLDPIGVTWFRAAKPLAGVSPAQAYGQHVLFKPPGLPGKDPATGNYVVEASTGTSILVPTDGGAAHYAIFSAGADRQGAYNRDGKVTVACGAVGLDNQNCVTATATGIYVAAPNSTAHKPDNDPSPLRCSYKDGSGACVAIADTHFDDHVKYFSETETPLWKVSSATVVGQDIQDLINAGGTGNGRIGIGGPIVTGQSEALQVTGDVHAATKVVAVQGLRSRTAANNVPLPLTSTCPAGQYATGLSNGSVVPNCVTAANGANVTCPPGQIVTGFSNGQVTCAQNVFCAAQSIKLCQTPTVATNDNRILPSSADQTVIDTLIVSGGFPNGSVPNAYSGASRHDTWKCNGGTWSRTGSVGVCSCTAQNNAPQSQTCYSYYGQSNPATYNNNVTWTQTTVCPAGTVTTTPKDHSACVCNNLVVPNVGPLTPCSPGYTGAGTQTTSTDTFTCSNPGGDGPGTWSNSSSTTGTCNCDPTYPAQQQDVTCPTGYSGTVHQTSAWTCSGNVGSFGPWTPAINNPPPAPCTCTGATDYLTNVPCGPGKTGTKTQVRTFNCGASPPDWTSYSDYDTSQCGTLTYVWKPVGNADPSSYSTPLSNQAYQSCGTQGATGDCSKANNGSYIYYLNNGCQCE